MQITLARHGLGVGRKTFLGAGGPVDYLTSALSTIAGDRGVKARAVAMAVESVTGIPPVIDTRDPKVTWIRAVPAHGEFVDAVFSKFAKGKAGVPSDLKVDLVPAMKPILFRRFLPVILLGAGVLFGAGYFSGKG